MKHALFALVLTGLVVVAGCQSDTPRDAPPDIRYGEDTCDQCRMIISEPRFAAAYITAQDEVRRFDGIGDMLLYHTTHAEYVAVFWVHDYNTEEWIKADQAFFVISKALHTPMGHGVVAFRTESHAVELAAKVQGRVLQFEELGHRFPLDAAASGHRHQNSHVLQHEQKVVTAAGQHKQDK